MRTLGFFAVLLAVPAFLVGVSLAIAADPTAGLVILAAASGLFWAGLLLLAAGQIVAAIDTAADRIVAAVRAGPRPS
jgi:hypothetical protein